MCSSSPVWSQFDTKDDVEIVKLPNKVPVYHAVMMMRLLEFLYDSSFPSYSLRLDWEMNS